jgi:hypothetical protein
MPQSEEKWATATNYLLRKKMPNNYYEIINGPSLEFSRQSVGDNGSKLSNSDYWDISNNLDPINLLTSFRLDLWNKLELLPDETSDGRLCYHFLYRKKRLTLK